MLKRFVTLAVLAALVPLSQTARADDVLINDLVFTQATLVLSTLDGISVETADQGVPIDIGALSHYVGTFGLSQDAMGNTIGSFEGNLLGAYAGLPLNVAYSGDLQPVPPSVADPTLTGTATGDYGPSPVTVTLTVVDPNDATKKVKVTGKYTIIKEKDITGDDNFTVNSDPVTKKTTYDGHAKFGSEDEQLTIVIDNEVKDKKRAFTAHIHSGPKADFDVTGTFAAAAIQPPPPGQNFDIVFDAQFQVPEPATLSLLGTGVLCLLGRGLWRRHRSAGQ